MKNASEVPDQARAERLIAELEPRQGLYRLLARLLLAAPDSQLLEILRKPEFSAVNHQFKLELGVSPGNDAYFLEQLELEFTRLFLGPGKHISPHESVQISKDGVLNDPTTASVARFIEEAGFRFKANSGPYPDHVCTEFEFMETLIGRQIDAINNEDAREAETSRMLQQEFVQRHLIKWIPGFCKRIKETTTQPMYIGLASMLDEFIQMEYAFLDNPTGTAI